MKETPGGFECEAELLGGSQDGFRFTMIRHRRPAIGCRYLRNQELYVLVAFEDGVAKLKFKQTRDISQQ